MDVVLLGNTMPPTLEPDMTIPVASARRRWNQCDMTASAGKNRTPRPIPAARPWARNTCQYVLHRLVMKILRSASDLRLELLNARTLRHK
jgi:hypothetical protein